MCTWFEFAGVFVLLPPTHWIGTVASDKTKVDYQSSFSSRREILPLTLAKLQHSKWPRWNRQTHKWVRLKCTSVFCPFHVEPSLIRLKICRSRFLGPIVQLADFMANDKIVALTGDFFSTPEMAAFIPLNLKRFNGVTSEEHSSNGVFRWRLTLSSNLKKADPGHQENNWEPELGIHIELNASVSLLEVKQKRSKWYVDST